MEKFKFKLFVEGSPNEAALTRLKRTDCTMLGRLQNNIDWKTSSLNVMIKSYYTIDENLQKGGNVKPYRFVEGEKVLFAKVFKEPSRDYNRRRKKEDEVEETYYDKLDERRKKTHERYESFPKGKKKEEARKKKFHISRDLKITIGDEEHFPTKEQMDSFGKKYLEWFEQQFPQMPVFMCVITYDDLEKKVLQPPTLHICVLPTAYKNPGSNRKREKVVAWNRCLEQSLNTRKGKETFIKFREIMLSAADKIAKEHGFCRERPRGYSNLKE